MIQILQNIQVKLFFSIISLLLLVIVTYTEPFLQKTIAQSNTHIVAAGDWGCSNNTEKTVKSANSMNPQLVLALGDYSYEKTATCWLNIIKPINSITKINFGNHEDESDEDFSRYMSHFGLSKQYYSFDVHNVHVLTMATEEEFGSKSDQYNFVVNDLRKAANNPDVKWIIVTMHYPFYSSPNTCKESDCAGNEESRELYHPLFDKYGVDLVLQGHVHNYQRSFPLNFNQESSSSSKPLVISTNKAEYKNPNGAIFAIVGTGGVNLHGLSGFSSFMANQEDSKFGILDMHFSDNKLDAKFVTNDGSTLDHFSISKTVKKKIIERISDNVVTDDKAKPVSDKEDKPAVSKELSDDIVTDDKAKPVSDKEDKPAVSKELSDDIFADDKAKPVSDKEDKPAVSKELSDDIVTVDKLKSLLHKEDGKSNPLSDKIILTDDKPKALPDKEDKPAVSKEPSDDIVTDDKPKPPSDKVILTDDKPKPPSDKVILTDDKPKALPDKEDKPAVSKELSDDIVTDDKPKPPSDKVILTDDKPALSDEDKPAASKELSDDLVTDDKPKQLPDEDKIVTDDKPKQLPDEDKIVTDDKPKSLSDEEDKPAKSDEDKPTAYQNSETEDKSNVSGLHGPLDNNDNDVDHDEILNRDTEGSSNTNEKDPFASLN